MHFTFFCIEEMGEFYSFAFPLENLCHRYPGEVITSRAGGRICLLGEIEFKVLLRAIIVIIVVVPLDLLSGLATKF